MALVASGGMPMELAIFVHIGAVVVIASMVSWSVVTSMQTSVFLTSQRRSSSFTVDTLEIWLVVWCDLSKVT